MEIGDSELLGCKIKYSTKEISSIDKVKDSTKKMANDIIESTRNYYYDEISYSSSKLIGKYAFIKFMKIVNSFKNIEKNGNSTRTEKILLKLLKKEPFFLMMINNEVDISKYLASKEIREAGKVAVKNAFNNNGKLIQRKLHLTYGKLFGFSNEEINNICH